MKTTDYEEAVASSVPHPTQATKGWSADAYLRKHGWRIVSRKTGKPAVWERNGHYAAQDEAMRLSRRDK